MNEFVSNIPARGAALLERNRMIKAGLCVAGAVLAVGVIRRFHKPLLAAAAAIYLGTRPPVKQFLSRVASVWKGAAP